MDGRNEKDGDPMEILRKKDLHPKVGVAKSTVADWIEDFNIYIPQSKKGNVTYYRPETIDVLMFIKQCREQNYQKQQIMEALAAKGFPVTVEEVKNDAEKAISNDINSQDNHDFLAVIQTMGQAVQQLSDQDESIKYLRDKGREHEGRMNEIERRTEETGETIDDLKAEIEELKQELAATKEKKRKQGFWARLFKRNKDN